MVLWLHNACIIFIHIMHDGKCFHLRAGFRSGTALSVVEMHSGDEGLRLTQVTLNLGWKKAAVATGTPHRQTHSQTCPSFPFIYFTFPLLFHSLYSKSSREAMNKVKGAFAYVTHGTFFVREITLACFYFSTSLRSNSICIFWLKRLLPYNILPGCPYSSNLYY